MKEDRSEHVENNSPAQIFITNTTESSALPHIGCHSDSNQPAITPELRKPLQKNLQDNLLIILILEEFLELSNVQNETLL